MSIIFCTTNKGKLSEASQVLNNEIEGVELPIDEIQSLDPIEVALKKARAYFSEVKKPLFIEDVSLSFNILNGLPGTYINDFLKAIGNEGLIKLLDNQNDRSAIALTTLVYINQSGEEYIFQGEMKGTIASKLKGDNGFGWDPIFIPEGQQKTLGEMTNQEKNQYSMRAIALKKMSEFLES